MDMPEYRMFMDGRGIAKSVFSDATKVAAVMTPEQQMILARVASVLREIDHCFHAMITKRNCPDLCHQDIQQLVCELDLRFAMDDYDKNFWGSDAWQVRFGGETLDSIEEGYKEDSDV